MRVYQRIRCPSRCTNWWHPSVLASGCLTAHHRTRLFPWAATRDTRRVLFPKCSEFDSLLMANGTASVLRGSSPILAWTQQASIALLVDRHPRHLLVGAVGTDAELQALPEKRVVESAVVHCATGFRDGNPMALRALQRPDALSNERRLAMGSRRAKSLRHYLGRRVIKSNAHDGNGRIETVKRQSTPRMIHGV